MSEKMDGDNGFGPLRDGGFDFFRIDIEGVRTDIDENRFDADLRRDFGRGDEGKRRRDNFVAGGDAAGAQRQKKRVRAVGAADGRSQAVISGDFFFQLADIRPQDELRIGQHLAYGLVDVGFQPRILLF